MEGKKTNWLGYIAVTLALIAVIHSFTVAPAVDRVDRPTVSRIADWAAWLWMAPVRRDESHDTEAVDKEEADAEPNRVMDAMPREFATDNQPPQRAMSMSGEPILDHGHGW